MVNVKIKDAEMVCGYFFKILIELFVCNLVRHNRVRIRVGIAVQVCVVVS